MRKSTEPYPSEPQGGGFAMYFLIGANYFLWSFSSREVWQDGFWWRSFLIGDNMGLLC
jgi:hypothetical protein